MKIEAAVREYIIEIEIRKYTPKTIKGYRNNLNLFVRFCAEKQGVYELEDISLGLIRQYTQFLVGQGKKGTYVNGILKSIKSFVQYCYEEGHGGFNTRKNFKWCKEERPVILTFEPIQVKRMLQRCGGHRFIDVRDRAILSTLFETGIRCQELCDIKREDIHSDFIIINGKNHKQRVVPLTPILEKALLQYEQSANTYFDLKRRDDYFFLSFHGRKLTVGAVEHILKKRGEGIEGIRVSPHTCRHFFAQTQVKLGTDLYTISRLLGHENIAITQTYLNSLRDKSVIEIAKEKSVLMSI